MVTGMHPCLLQRQGLFEQPNNRGLLSEDSVSGCGSNVFIEFSFFLIDTQATSDRV